MGSIEQVGKNIEKHLLGKVEAAEIVDDLWLIEKSKNDILKDKKKYFIDLLTLFILAL